MLYNFVEEKTIIMLQQIFKVFVITPGSASTAFSNIS